MKRSIFVLTLFLTLVLASYPPPVRSAETPEGTALIDSHGYHGCVLLFNTSTRVILEPNCGGRLLEYSRDGVNALYVDPAQDGWTYTPGEKAIDPSGGRFDIGPEMTAPRHPALWIGRWTAEITGPRTARMTSAPDSATGVQLVREFELDPETSHLRCRQIIRNVSGETKRYNHWSRTFGDGGGVCVVPLTPETSRFPRGYIYYGPGGVLNYQHEPHPNIRVRDGFLEIPGPPPERKFGIDSHAGWLGYITPKNLLFVKRFPAPADYPYGEVAAYTISLWYNARIMCELEPIGPTQVIAPGKSAVFTEDWWLFPWNFPKEGEKADLIALSAFVKTSARSVVAPDAKVVKAAGGYTWAEGPALDRDGNVYFTDNRENLIHRMTPAGKAAVFMNPARRANGLYTDRDGSILACAGDPKALVSFRADGTVTTVVDSYNGKPFNAPNDLWLDPKGGVYFTDPYWGREPGRSRVYYLAPDRTTLTPVILDMVRPNGVIGSPDGSRLYVTDWDEKKTYAYSIAPDGLLYDRRLFAPEGDDGMAVDSKGNVYLSGSAVTVYDPDGIKIDTIEVPETPANMIFTGPARDTLLITARTGVYMVKTRVKGL